MFSDVLQNNNNSVKIRREHDPISIVVDKTEDSKPLNAYYQITTGSV